MTSSEILHLQTKDAYNWVNKLVNSVPLEQWDDRPEGIDTSVSWQVGHLILSFYYHSVMVIKGHDMEIMELVPIKKYSEVYYYESDSKSALGKMEPKVLLKHLNIIQDKTLKIIKGLSEEQLKSKLERTTQEHPVAKTKFEAISWNIKHTMWHCGQIAMVKRSVNERYQFNLKKK